jgi:AcrR family transcriptional regulator
MDQQILDAARAVFLEEGFGTPTLKVAHRAGVSEGTIFKRFQTKEKLFAAALEIEYPPAWYRLVEERKGKGDVLENFSAIMVSILSFHLDSVPRMLSLLGNPHHKISDGPPARLVELRQKDFETLTGYIQEEIDQGRLRRCNSRVLAQLIIGSIVDHAIHAMINQQSISDSERQQIVQGMLLIFWAGIAPEKS